MPVTHSSQRVKLCKETYVTDQNTLCCVSSFLIFRWLHLSTMIKVKLSVFFHWLGMIEAN